MKITLKAKLTVSEDQHTVLDRMAFASTKLWNTANWERRQKWEQTEKIPNYYEQEAVLRDNPWHKRLPHHSAQAVSWSFNQFTQMLSYKAARAGISVRKVSERNSSKTCSICATVRKSNRIHRGLYRCKNCGEELNADVSGASNILKTYLESLEAGRPVVAHLEVPLVRRWNHVFC